MTPRTTPTGLPAGIRRRGGKYLATVYLGTDIATGRKTTRSKTFTNKTTAADWLRLQRTAAKGDTRSSPELLGNLLGRWLEFKQYEVDVDELKQSTFSWYRSAVERHLIPAPIARVRLRDLNSDQLRRFLSAKRKSGRLDGKGGLGADSVRRLSTVLHAALGYAVDEEWLAKNPMDKIRIPSKTASTTARELEWTANDLRTFLDHHREDRLFPAWRVMAVTGLRRGELLGLKWTDLRIPDIGTPTLTIRRTIVTVDGTPTISTPKTEGSIRTAPIDPDTVQVLEAWRERQMSGRAEWDTAWHTDSWVFTKEDGTYVRPDTFSRRTVQATKDAGLPAFTPHKWRHLAGTLLLEAGVPLKVVSDVLGHSSTTVTSDIYQHVRESLAAEAVGHIADQL